MGADDTKTAVGEGLFAYAKGNNGCATSHRIITAACLKLPGQRFIQLYKAGLK